MGSPATLSAQRTAEAPGAATSARPSVATARAILDSDPAQALFERERARHPDDFAEVVDWMLDNLELIRRERREGGRKVWWPADRRAATPPVE